MIDLRWTKGSTDLVSFEYDYDRVRNRLNQRNLVDGTGGANPEVDSLFEYDQLNRLTNYQGGELNTAGDAITSPVIEQDFTLDETGNFTDFLVKDNGTTTLDQARTQNTVNEITNITETTGSSWITPVFDTAGSMTTIPKPADLTAGFVGTWDAWNRLVKLVAGGRTVATYEYDGTNRRIIKGVYSAGSLDSTRHVYYSLQAQALEERVDSETDAEIQFIWNLNYVDDLLLRDRDTTANGTLDERLYSLPDLRYCVMALADTSGSIVERFKYEVYGESQAMTDLFVDRSSSSYDWEFRYTGRREDLETGLLFFRARFYSPQLGRFISRDPLGFVDGMSLYRGYFVPGAVDPMGMDLDASAQCGEPLGKLKCRSLIEELMWGAFGPLVRCAINRGCLYNRSRVLCSWCDNGFIAYYGHTGSWRDVIVFCYNNFNSLSPSERRKYALEEAYHALTICSYGKATHGYLGVLDRMLAPFIGLGKTECAKCWGREAFAKVCARFHTGGSINPYHFINELDASCAACDFNQLTPTDPQFGIFMKWAKGIGDVPSVVKTRQWPR